MPACTTFIFLSMFLKFRIFVRSVWSAATSFNIFWLQLFWVALYFFQDLYFEFFVNCLWFLSSVWIWHTISNSFSYSCPISSNFFIRRGSWIRLKGIAYLPSPIIGCLRFTILAEINLWFILIPIHWIFQFQLYFKRFFSMYILSILDWIGLFIM